MARICVDDTQKLTNVQIGLNFILTSFLPLKMDILAKVKKVTKSEYICVYVYIFHISKTLLYSHLKAGGSSWSV